MTDIELLRIQLKATQKALIRVVADNRDLKAHNHTLKERIEKQADRILELMFPRRGQGRDRR